MGSCEVLRRRELVLALLLAAVPPLGLGCSSRHDDAWLRELRNREALLPEAQELAGADGAFSARVRAVLKSPPTSGEEGTFLSLDIGTLPAGKTRVVRFDLGDGLACADIGRLLLDDVTNCQGGDLTPATCLQAISLSSRASVPIDY